jgi:Apolipoprotein N-acyltransferase
MGAEVLVVLANDAYAGRGTVPGLHVRAARMRAVENGLPVVFVQATGPSAVIDHYGRVVASTRHGLVETLDVDVVVEGHGTPYRRWGDVVGALAAWSAAACAAAWAWSRSRPGSKGGEAAGVVVR